LGPVEASAGFRAREVRKADFFLPAAVAPTKRNPLFLFADKTRLNAGDFEFPVSFADQFSRRNSFNGGLQ
jgi:hypothetical protein